MTQQYPARLLAGLIFLAAGLHAAAAPIDDLTAAAERDNAREVRSLLLKGVDPNAMDQRGRSALALALREESGEALEALLADPRLDLNAANANGETPLMLAAIKGRLAWVQQLARRGARINQPGWTPLHYACSGPDNGVAAWLVQQGAELNARSPNGTTPLMMAARYGAMDTVPLLLKAGADTALKNEQNLTAADFAKKAGRDRSLQQIEAAARR